MLHTLRQKCKLLLLYNVNDLSIYLFFKFSLLKDLRSVSFRTLELNLKFRRDSLWVKISSLQLYLWAFRSEIFIFQGQSRCVSISIQSVEGFEKRIRKFQRFLQLFEATLALKIIIL